MEINLFGEIAIIDFWEIMVSELIGAVVGEIPFIGTGIMCVYDFSIKVAELFWNFGIKIPTSCIFGLTEIDRSFYKGMEEFPLVLYDLIKHLFGKG